MNKEKVKAFWHKYHHLIEALMWVVLAVPTLLFWKESILWVALMSLYANYKTAISAHEGRMNRMESSEKTEQQ